MKRKRIALVLAMLFVIAGCTVSATDHKDPAPSVSSAGNAAVQTEKRIAEVLKEEAEKATAVIAREKETAKKEAAEEPMSAESGSDEKDSSAGSNFLPASSKQPVQQQSVTKEASYSEPEPETEPVHDESGYQEPAVIPPSEPAVPPQACPGGKNPDLGCEVILDTNYYRETFGSYNEAMARGQYYMDEVMYIGDFEITSYSIQEVYRNDHSIAYYGLNLWSNGSLIQ